MMAPHRHSKPHALSSHHIIHKINALFMYIQNLIKSQRQNPICFSLHTHTRPTSNIIKSGNQKIERKEKRIISTRETKLDHTNF